MQLNMFVCFFKNLQLSNYDCKKREIYRLHIVLSQPASVTVFLLEWQKAELVENNAMEIC